MFNNATSFNADLSSWDVSNVSFMTSIFDETDALSEENKCAIHSTWQSNNNWEYDWSSFCQLCHQATWLDPPRIIPFLYLGVRQEDARIT